MEKITLSFVVAPSTIFEVNNCHVLKNPYFSTSASVWNNRRTDISRGGQCQEYVLPKESLAYEFFEKWDKFHLHKLNEEQTKELEFDLKALKDFYPYIDSTTGWEQVNLLREDSTKKFLRKLKNQK